MSFSSFYQERIPFQKVGRQEKFQPDVQHEFVHLKSHLPLKIGTTCPVT